MRRSILSDEHQKEPNPRFCTTCKAIDSRKLFAPSARDCLPLKHHKDFKSLQTSASGGCPICQVLLRGLLDEYIRTLNWGEERTIAYQLHRDTHIKDVFYLSVAGGNNHLRKAGFYGLSLARYSRAKSHCCECEKGGSRRAASLQCSVSLVSRSGCHPYVFGRQRTQEPNVQLARHWIEQCSRTHTGTYTNGQKPCHGHTVPTCPYYAPQNHNYFLRYGETVSPCVSAGS